MTSDHMETRSSSSSGDRYHMDAKTFDGSVHIVNLERGSLSRRLERVYCLLACDDNASVNLYIDQRLELDYIVFRLTHGIRHLYLYKKTRTVKIQLSTHQRLDITLDTDDQCQALHDQLLHIKTRPSDTDNFPRHQPKVGIAKPDPTAAYLTANDTPSQLQFNPSFASATVPSTPLKKRSMEPRHTAATDHSSKKTRVKQPDLTSDSYRHSKESYDPILSSSPIAFEDTPERWRPPSSPEYREDQSLTPRRSKSLRQAVNQFERFGCLTSSDTAHFPRPQFHSIAPTPRVLRSMSDRTRRYGREGGIRKSKRLSLSESSNSSRCIPAVLQALFCLDPVVKDLQEPYWLRFSGAQPGLFRSLVDSYVPYLKNRTVDVNEETVSYNVVKTTKGSVGDEDDAREFLNDTLNQLRQEFRERNADISYPLSRLFECNIEHTVVCTDCGGETVHTEHYQDFRLELPPCETNKSSQRAISIGSLFPQVFEDQQISFQCNQCRSENATVRRSISKLPDVLVVHLKRFTPRPNSDYSKNRSRVTIDETLEFSQFCSPGALLPEDTLPLLARYSDDDQLHGHLHIPSDGFPSSSSSQFSSSSPSRHEDNLFHSYSPTVGQADYDHDNADLYDRDIADLYDPPEQGSAVNPLLLNSDEEDSNDVSLSQQYSFYETPSEDEQYLWAMEESLRASQTLSQEFACDGDADEARVKNEPDYSKSSLPVFGAENPFANKEYTKNVHDLPDTPDEARVSKRTKLSSDNERNIAARDESNIATRDERRDDAEGKKSVDDDGDEDEDEDEDLKAAIIASLESTDTTALSEKELQEQENKEFEEAIKRSLLDFEENKENISPEQPEGKKGKKGKKSAKLTRSCSQSLTLALDRPKSLPPTLRRAISVNDTARLRSSRRRSQSSSQYLSQEESANFFSDTRRSRGSGEELWSSTHMSAEEPTTASESRGKGKGKAPKRMQVETKEQSLGIFQLQAAISHTGITSSTVDGHYVCDYLGADGDWRYQDGDKRMKTGPMSELNKSRGRTGYLFFYVRRRPESEAP